MDKSRTDIDRIFDHGIADVERTPRKTLSEAEIAAAAAASKSGAGVFLRSHTKEILLCTISFAAICLVTIAVLHFSSPKSSESQSDATAVQIDTMELPVEPEGTAVETFPETSPETSLEMSSETFQETSLQNDHPVSASEVPTSNVSRPTSNAPTANSQRLTPNSPEPVVVKKTIVKRDTVVINETVVIKDTTYVP